jgi:hypothetical protein
MVRRNTRLIIYGWRKQLCEDKNYCMREFHDFGSFILVAVLKSFRYPAR